MQTEPPLIQPEVSQPAGLLKRELIIAFLAMISVVLLIIEVAGAYTAEDRQLLEKVDVAIALIFLAEFTFRLAFHYFEEGVNRNVASLFDSFWFVMSTVTTAGYGDIVPVTTGGRIVAMILMIVGIGTIGLLTALVASYFVRARNAS